MPHDHAIHQMMRVPCTVIHAEPGTADEYGDQPIAPLTTTEERCYLAQSTRGEMGDVETERWHVYLLPWTEIDANDTIDVDGMELEVIGNPWGVIDPVTGFRTHIECTAVRRR